MGKIKDIFFKGINVDYKPEPRGFGITLYKVESQLIHHTLTEIKPMKMPSNYLRFGIYEDSFKERIK